MERCDNRLSAFPAEARETRESLKFYPIFARNGRVRKNGVGSLLPLAESSKESRIQWQKAPDTLSCCFLACGDTMRRQFEPTPCEPQETRDVRLD